MVHDRVSCFMRSNLTSVTGYFEQTVPIYLPDEFKHHFKMTKTTFKLTREINRLQELLTAKTYACLGKQLQTCCNCTWMVQVTPIDRLLTIHKSCNDRCFPPFWTWKILNSEVLGLRMGSNEMVHFDQTGPTEKSARGPPEKVDRFFSKLLRFD